MPRRAESESQTTNCDKQGQADSLCLLGDRIFCLVLPSIPSRLGPDPREIVASNMALATAVLTLAELLVICLGFASLGNILLRFLRLEMERDAEHLLCAVAVGLVASEALIFLVEFTQQIQSGCFVIVALLCCLLILESKRIWKRLRRVLKEVAQQSSLGKILLVFTLGVGLIEFLLAMAPLTGSDALVYHFAVQKQILEEGFRAIFSNSHSFLCGQHHLLILLGLALGSEQLGMGFIFLGGVLTAAALVCLASRWASGQVAIAFALLFLLTPLVFWQVTTSGSPDIFMAFFATMAAMVLCQSRSPRTWQRAFLVGLLAGGVAGAKYTGCFVAAAIALAVVIELRSIASVSFFAAGSWVSGIWPYLRNLVWTGDPVFPFLAKQLSPGLAAPYTLADFFADTGTSVSHGLAQVLPFMFFAGAHSSSPGPWEFFGPVVLILAPLILLAFDNERQWRVLVLVWVLSALGIAFSSGMPRFLLPVFPLALACAAGGFEVSKREGWTVVTRAIGSLLLLTGLGCAAGLAIYSREPLRFAVGQEGKTQYLRARGPDFEIAQAINRVLGGVGNQQRVLVFVRHAYYLDVPYVNGDPSVSFEVDPTKFRSPENWRVFFEKKNIGYVVRSPSYPSVIAGPLEEMEKMGDLAIIARADAQSFQGNRLDQVRTGIAVVVLRVVH